MSTAVIVYDGVMSRWQPDARGRLTEAALTLYRERGFEQTTVEEIATRAGLTERTFFRHFADKREVLFAGSHLLVEQVRRTVVAVSPGVAPIDAVAAGFDALAPNFDESRAHQRLRYAVIAASPELLERERVKLAVLATAIAEALCRRGVTANEATLVAELAVAVFRVGFERWLEADESRPFAEVMRTAIDELKRVGGGAFSAGERTRTPAR